MNLPLLKGIQTHVRPGGCAIVNVLTEGTTYMEMFQPSRYYLFGRDELEESFSGWQVRLSRYDSFEASGSTVKEFATVVMQKS